MNLYWGDLHNHCGISYGHGSLSAALQRARGQLDFCSVTGHAFWPDMPHDRDRYAWIIDFHTEGFRKLASGWPRVLADMAAASREGEFIVFPGFEWHSRAQGDRVVILQECAGPLATGDTVDELHAAQGGRSHIIYPHHVGYPRGFRGIDWDSLRPEFEPLVELHSMHGCSESDEAPYPMLHTMGPRDHDSTIQAGLARGHRFGFAAGTDHHSAYPGSWGDGRLAVWASALTREALFEAFRARRTYAVTGDKMLLEFSVAGAGPGEVTRATGPRQVHWRLTACDFVDKVELLKNNRLVQRWDGSLRASDGTGPVRCKVRIEWGWGEKDNPVVWEAALHLDGGRLRGVETCFSGFPILMPTHGHADEIALPHELVEQDESGCHWRSMTLGNPTTRHATTQSLIAEVEMSPNDALVVEANGYRVRHTLTELLAGARAHYVRGFMSEAIRIHRAVSADCYQMEGEWTDDEATSDCDWYYLRVAQRNNQWAWVTPVWVETG